MKIQNIETALKPSAKKFKKNKELKKVMKIGRRDISIFIKRIFSLENYKAIINFNKVHEQPFKSIYQEIFSLGKFPRKIKFNAPTGKQEIEIYSSADFSTFNLIFCRQDYYIPKKLEVVVDIGSNIGLSSIYWLTRNSYSKVYCFEPSTINFKRLEKNLEFFKTRCFLNNFAVSSYSGTGFLNLDKNGVYSSLTNNDFDYTGKEKVNIANINKCLEKILNENKEIDILKVDNEGEELKTISSINKYFWKFIKCVNVDGLDVRKYIPTDFKSSIVGSAQRFYKN